MDTMGGMLITSDSSSMALLPAALKLRSNSAGRCELVAGTRAPLLLAPLLAAAAGSSLAFSTMKLTPVA
jgi:hypothetical protein